MIAQHTSNFLCYFIVLVGLSWGLGSKGPFVSYIIINVIVFLALQMQKKKQYSLIDFSLNIQSKSLRDKTSAI